MSNQDFIDVPDSNRWSNVPKPPEQPQEPVQPEPPVQPDEQEPVVSEPVPEVVFTSEPVSPQPEPVIYDPVRDEHEPYVEVKANSDGFESAPSVPKTPVYTPPPAEKKKMSGWVIALIVLLVLCICVVIGVTVLFFMISSGDYRIEWSYLINSALSFL